MSAFYLESRIAERLRIPRDTLKFVREKILKKNAGWKMRGRDVVLSEPGLQQVLDHLEYGYPLPNFEDCRVPLQEKNGQAETVELVVKRIYPNPRLLLATIVGEGRDVRVMVKNNLNFRPNMKIQARPDPRTDVYHLEGRCPRFPGRF